MTGTNFPNGVAVSKKFSGNTDTENRYDLNAVTKYIRKTAVIRCIGSEADNSERTTDFTFPAQVIVHDVFLNVVTVDAGETVLVGTEGTSNDPNGFLNLSLISALGTVYGSLLDGTITRGALLSEITEATTAAARRPCTTCGGDPVSYTCSAGTDTAVFDIIIDYTEVVTT